MQVRHKLILKGTTGVVGLFKQKLLFPLHFSNLNFTSKGSTYSVIYVQFSSKSINAHLSMRATAVLPTLFCVMGKFLNVQNLQMYLSQILSILANNKLAELATLIVSSQARSLNIYSNNLMWVQNDVCCCLFNVTDPILSPNQSHFGISYSA